MTKKSPPSMREVEGIANVIHVHLFSGVSRETLRSRKHCSKCMEEITPTMPMKTSDEKSITAVGRAERENVQGVSSSAHAKKVWIVEVKDPLVEGEASQLTTCPLWNKPKGFFGRLGKWIGGKVAHRAKVNEQRWTRSRS